MYIEFLGTPGSGKTTLCRNLSCEYKMNAITEGEDVFDRMFFVSEAFDNLERYSWAMNLNFLAMHLNRQLAAIHENPNANGYMSDSSFFMTLAMNDLGERSPDYDLYKTLVDRNYEQMPKVSARILVATTPEIIEQRLIARGRSADRGFDINFIRGVKDALDRTIAEDDLGVPCICVNGDLSPEEMLIDAKAKLHEAGVFMRPTLGAKSSFTGLHGPK